MTALLALGAGLAIGFLLGRIGMQRKEPRPPVPPVDEIAVDGRHRPSRRQRRILATLPPDPERPDAEALAKIEAAELGIDALDGADGLPAHVLLPVWRRDRPAHAACAEEGLGFRLQPDVAPGDATVDDVHLACSAHSGAGGST